MAEAKTFTSARVKGCLTSVIFIILMYQLWRFANYHDNTVSVERTEKPQGIPIIGVVFYGRREFVDVLDCYLRKNLASQGGYLDEVRFVVRTENATDVTWVDALVAGQPDYTRVEVSINSTFASIYEEHMLDRSAVYIKIDDDILFVDNDAIPRLVHGLLSRPEAYAMSAYVINNSRTNWLAYHTGAIHPFLPEKKVKGQNRTIEWRTSTLPAYSNDDGIPSDLLHTDPVEVLNYRWLPLTDTAANMAKTPMSYADWSEYGYAWRFWAMAAQQHYSFFKNMEEEKLSRYYVGDSSTGIWDMKGERYSINFFAIRGSTLRLAPIVDIDEISISVTNPKLLNMPFLVDSRAIVSHYAYKSQRIGMRWTDVLDRYRALANEIVCPWNLQKTYFQTERDPVVLG